MSFEYDGKLIRCIDGDTVVLHLEKVFSFPIDFGFYVRDTVSLTKSADITFRLSNINAPELHGDTATAGQAAKAALIALLSGPLKVVSYKPDKYGRWLCTVYAIQPDGSLLNVNDEMIKLGHAVAYSC